MKLADEMREFSNKNNMDEIEVERYYNYIIGCIKSTASRGVAKSIAFKSMFFSNNSSTQNFFKVADKLLNDGFECYFKKLHNEDDIPGTFFVVSWKDKNKH